MRVGKRNERNEDNVHVSYLNMWMKAVPFLEIQKTEVKIRHWRREEIIKTENKFNHWEQ